MTLMLLYKIIFILTAFGAGVITVDIFFKKNRGTKFETLFGLMSVSFVIWAAGRFGVLMAADYNNALFWAHFLYNGSILVHVFFLHVILVMLEKDKGIVHRLILFFFYSLAAFLLFFNNIYFFGGANYLVADMAPIANFAFYEVPDALYNLHMLSYLFIPFYCLLLMAKTLPSLPEQKKNQVKTVILASTLGFFGGNSVVPLVYGINFQPYLLVLIPFYIPVLTYAIAKHRLFNIKIVTTEIFAFFLWIFILVRIFVSDSPTEQTANSILLLLTLIIGTFLIRSVMKEVEQREKIEKLAGDLEEANKRQETLIHFISHEVKGYLTKSEGVFAGIIEGDFGEVGPKIKNVAETALSDNRRGVKSVTDILQASNLKSGKVSYEMKPFDLRQTALGLAERFKKEAEGKGLRFEVQIPEGGNYQISGDEAQISEHVFGNIIKNAIIYTVKGGIFVSLSKQAGKILFSVKDTGLGISAEDKARLFTEGGKGKESIKTNVHSTGYGLFIAKQIVDAHRGRIWAESPCSAPGYGRANEEEGKGSAFFVEFSAD